jgi:hypothetical protein
LFVFSVLLANLAPVLLMPLFNKFTPLGEEHKELAERLLHLAERAHTKVQGVFKFDMSRRTTQANAALTGIGNTRLRCSRTSLGWSADSGKLYMLFVIDPDGEFAGIQQKKRDRQTGGWNLPQLQRYWEKLGVPNAIIVDGGDSTQFAIRRPEGTYQVRRSGYQLSWTFGYLRNRPLRAFVPALPPAEAHVGVMNFLYL